MERGSREKWVFVSQCWVASSSTIFRGRQLATQGSRWFDSSLKPGRPETQEEFLFPLKSTVQNKNLTSWTKRSRARGILSSLREQLTFWIYSSHQSSRQDICIKDGSLFNFWPPGSQNNCTEIPRTMFEQTPGHPCLEAQSNGSLQTQTKGVVFWCPESRVIV